MPADIILTDDAVILTSEPGKGHPNKGTRLLMPGTGAAVDLSDGSSRTEIKSGSVNVVGSVQASEVETPRIDVKPAAFGEGRPGGRLALSDKNGMQTIDLLADEADIHIHGIGSLSDKLREIEQRLDALGA